MAREYGMLPSQVILQANTYDLMVMDVLAVYEQYQQDKADGKPTKVALSKQEMQDALDKVRGKK